MNYLEIYWTDVYKTGHKPMLPVGSVLMQSNLTPRSGKYSNCPNGGEIVSIGQQMMVRKMKEDWDNNFFKRPVEEIYQFGEDLTRMLMLDTPYDVSHFIALHKLGYLPIDITAIDEGNLLPYKIPLFTIVNTHPITKDIVDWLVNYLETILSAESWQCPTSATLSLSLKRLSKKWTLQTDPENLWFIDYQNHDFSMRGMGGKSAINNSGIGFSVFSRGSDTLPVIPAARKYYDEPLNEVVINSVIASEHAIMCSLTGFFIKTKGGSWDKIGDFEYETFLYLLKKFPSGILSLVMDTWDLWRAVTDYCRRAKDVIMARNGKLVIRPDSGDPVDIVCGTIMSLGTKEEWENIIKSKTYRTSKEKGVVELLFEIFGGTITSTGYKKLDSHIGVIYGDSINYTRAEQIYTRLEAKGFASTNIVLGVGSYSLQYVTRDTHGIAQKATYIEIEVDGETEGIEIFKDPITDDGVKKSAKGLLAVHKIDGKYILKDQCSWEEVNSPENQLKTIFKDGEFFNVTTYTKIREIANQYV